MKKQRNAWLIRGIPHYNNRVKLFTEKGFIAIGWPHLGDLSHCTKEDIEEKLTKEPYSLEGRKLGADASALNRFVNEFEEDDLVLLPDGDDIYLGIITSGYIYDKTVDTDEGGYPHQRRVTWELHVLRNDLPDALRNSLKAKNIIARLTPHLDTIEALLEGEEVAVSASLISVEYPLRVNQSIHLEVPQDMTKMEAERLGNYIATLYFEE